MSCKKLQIIAVAVSAILLSACGNSGGGGVADSRDASVVSGVAHDAPLVNSPVRIYAWDGGTKGELLATTTTDSKGDYETTLNTHDRPILIEAGGGGSYTEEASGVRVNLKSNQFMTAVTQYQSGKAIDVQMTPLSTIAACYADYLVSTGTLVTDSINFANAKFSAIYGIEVISDRPIDVTDPENASFTLSDGHKYGFITAGISQFMANDVSEANDLPPHGAPFLTSINWASVACGDIKADGRLNGFGYSGAGNTLTNLSFGSYVITPQAYRTFIAQRMLTFVSSDNNRSNLSVDGVMVTFANGLSTSTDAVWDGQPADPVDNTGPAITAASAPNTAFSGASSINFEINDPVGVDSIQFFINNDLVSIGQTTNPQLNVNTQFYPDGEHTIKVVATDIIGNETTEEIVYRFWNSGPAITLTSAALTKSTSYLMTGTFNSPVADIASISIESTNAVINDDGTWSANLNLSNGNNNLTIQSQDSLGNGSSLDVTIAVDQNVPRINPEDRNVRFTTFQGQYNLCEFGDLTLTSGRDTPVCLRSDRVSLNGASVNSNLSNLEFILMAVRVSDPTGAGVFTAIEDLTAEYKYQQDSNDVFDWRPLTTRGSNSDIETFYLPFVTDFFGETFHQAPVNTTHNITIRISDEVGNTSEVKYEIKLDVLVPALSMDLVDNSETLFDVPFASRAVIDNSSLIQTTLFENVMGTPVYIDATPRTGSYATHFNERIQRKNKVRIKKSPEIRVAGVVNPNVTVFYNPTSNPHDPTRATLSRNHGTSYSGWQTPMSNTIPLGQPTSLMTGPNGYSLCHKSNLTSISGNANGNFRYQNGGTIHGCGHNDPRSPNRYPITSVTYNAVPSHDYAGADATCPSGYPCNPLTLEETNYNISSGEVTVKVDGVPASLANGRYVIPTGSTASIEYQVQMPNILHFNDSVVLNSSAIRDYNVYKYDTETNWHVDMRMDLEIAGSAESTPNIQVIGSLVEKTIER